MGIQKIMVFVLKLMNQTSYFDANWLCNLPYLVIYNQQLQAKKQSDFTAKQIIFQPIIQKFDYSPSEYLKIKHVYFGELIYIKIKFKYLIITFNVSTIKNTQLNITTGFVPKIFKIGSQKAGLNFYYLHCELWRFLSIILVSMVIHESANH